MVAGGPPTTRFRISVAAVMLAGAAGIVLMVAGALYATLSSGHDIADRLLRERRERTLETLIEHTQSLLEPVAEIGRYFAQEIHPGSLDPNDEINLFSHLAFSLAGLPQILKLSFIRPDGSNASVINRSSGLALFNADPNDDFARTMVVNADSSKALTENDLVRWDGVTWNERLDQAVVTLHVSLTGVGDPAGSLRIQIGMGTLSGLLNNHAGAAVSAFILDGSDRVLAHSVLAGSGATRRTAGRILEIREIDDPVLSQIWAGRRRNGSMHVPSGTEGHISDVAGEPYLFVYRTLQGYGDQPWLVGYHVALREAHADVSTFMRTSMVAGLALAIAVAGAMVLGRGIVTPMQTLADAAQRIRQLDFSGSLDRASRLREVDDAMRAFEGMRTGLRWFSQYMPRLLVARLMKDGEAILQPRRHVATVMFTDIVGFTGIAEDLPAEEVRAILNEHFQLIVGCIEQAGGFVDKFIGDGLMASWGTFDSDSTHADQAVAAAFAIAWSIAADNALRRIAGKPTIRIRVGIHSGAVVTGNIGSPDRMNYTVVGDAVNVAQRLERLGKVHMRAEDDVVVLLSDDTARDLTRRQDLEAIGTTIVDGRNRMINVWRLLLRLRS